MMSHETPLLPSDPGRLQGFAADELRLDSEQVRQILPQLIDSLTDAVLVVDHSQRVVAANRRYIEAFGAKRHDLVGSRCFDAVHCPELAYDVEPGRCAACEVLASREVRRMVRRVMDAERVPHRWEATLSPVMNGSGGVTHVVEVWRDISERSELELQLAHSERLASLGVLAAGVAHEVNNPIASVLAGVESLQRWLARADGLDPASAAEAREVLEVLEGAAQRCSEITEKLLLLAQPSRVAPGLIDLNRAVNDTLSLLGFEMRKHGVETRCELAPDLPALWAREAGLRSICMNLCMNAVQAMPEGGLLTLRTRSSGVGVVLEIEDTGPGISPENLGRIWDPFFTTKPAGLGTGLGLSITRGIVRRHGGSIHAETPATAGARFVVELPIAGPGGDGA